MRPLLSSSQPLGGLVHQSNLINRAILSVIGKLFGENSRIRADMQYILNSIIGSLFHSTTSRRPDSTEMNNDNRNSALDDGTSMLVWYSSIDDYSFSDNHHNLPHTFDSILQSLSSQGQLSTAEQKSITRFIFEDDRKRALLSILLQRAAIHRTFHCKDREEYSILRTTEVIILSALKRYYLSAKCPNNSLNSLEQTFLSSRDRLH